MSEGRSYTIEALLGRGGFGAVYRASLRGSGGFAKTVALKLLRPEVAEVAEVAQRFRDEARILGLLRHRSIVHVDGIFQAAGRHVLVMEYVHGADLSELIARGPVPPAAALAIVAEVASALDAASRAPGPDGRPLALLHRDIKPSNIQLTAAAEVKVLDFGIARADFAGREAETRSHLMGSLAYMAPERIDHVEHPGGDVFSLGVVLYELLSGETFGRASSNEVRHAAHLNRRLPDIADEAHRALLLRMLALDPEARPRPREVEREALRLARTAGDPDLRDWAEEAVPAAIALRRPAGDDPLTGSLLVEGGADALRSGPISSPTPTPSPTPPQGLRPAMTPALGLSSTPAPLPSAPGRPSAAVPPAARPLPAAPPTPAPGPPPRAEGRSAPTGGPSSAPALPTLPPATPPPPKTPPDLRAPPSSPSNAASPAQRSGPLFSSTASPAPSLPAAPPDLRAPPSSSSNAASPAQRSGTPPSSNALPAPLADSPFDDATRMTTVSPPPPPPKPRWAVGLLAGSLLLGFLVLAGGGLGLGMYLLGQRPSPTVEALSTPKPASPAGDPPPPARSPSPTPPVVALPPEDPPGAAPPASPPSAPTSATSRPIPAATPAPAAPPPSTPSPPPAPPPPPAVEAAPSRSVVLEGDLEALTLRCGGETLSLRRGAGPVPVADSPCTYTARFGAQTVSNTIQVRQGGPQTIRCDGGFQVCD